MNETNRSVKPSNSNKKNRKKNEQNKGRDTEMKTRDETKRRIAISSNNDPIKAVDADAINCSLFAIHADVENRRKTR